MNDLGAMRILVTPTSFGKYDPQLRAELEASVGTVIYNPTGRPLQAEELCELLPGCDGYIAGLDLINDQALAAADRLKVIARYGTGVDRVDLDGARSRGIAVTNTPGANAVSVAELTIGLILSLARNIPTANSATHAGEWPRLHGVSIAGKTVGLIGLGMIGKAVVRRLSQFECRVIAADPYVQPEAAKAMGIELLDQAVLIEQSDFISLHVPVTESTRGMVNSAFLSRVRRGSYLVNTARGELIDEAALVDALVSGRLAGAALDCFAQEPPDAGNPLLALPQVIATPHSGAHTDDAANAMARDAMDDCLRVLRGEEPTYRVV